MEDRLNPLPLARSGSHRDEQVALLALTAIFVVTAAWWLLAFWPVRDSAAWIVRTRYVCFGISRNSLPDAGGWIALTGGPFGMLVLLLSGWSRALQALVRRARTSRTIAATLAALVVGSVMLLGGATLRVLQARNADGALTELEPNSAASYPRLSRPVPALSLQSQNGGRFDLASLSGRVVLITFGYAHCETVCPLLVHRVLEAQSLVPSVAVVIVTLDPWRDTTGRLQAIAAAWQLPRDHAWLLSGAIDSVQAVLDHWKVPRARDTRTGEITHPGLVYVVDVNSQLAFAADAPGLETLLELARRARE